MIDCKVYSISQWDWKGGGLHNRFVWDFDRKSFYTEAGGTVYDYNDLLANYKVRLIPRLTFIME
jgi:hypothetical protein